MSVQAMTDCLISFGANLGNPREQFKSATAKLASTELVQLVKFSPLLETRPIGNVDAQPNYFNAAMLAKTEIGPLPLLKQLLKIETEIGRVRQERWKARIIDLDLLIYGNETLDSEVLVLPHPRMSFRRFMLEPSVEVAPDLIHPTSGITVRQLLQHLDERPNLILLVGDRHRVEFLAKQLASTIRQSTIQESQLLLGDSNDNVDQILSRITGQSVIEDPCKTKEGNTFMLIPITTPEQLDRWSAHAKLIIIDRCSDQPNLTKVASRFAGPMYRLPRLDDSQLSGELFAAIDAMRPI